MNYANNTLGRIGVIVLASALFLAGATIAFAATNYASTNESFTQGLQKNGDPVNPLRSVESDALGAPDGSFLSLGYGGELVVGFDQNMSGSLVLSVQEITGGTYPLETADVYVSTEPDGPWTYVGEATNEEGMGDGLTEFLVDDCYQYVHIVDTTDSSLHNATSDGFDVDALIAEYNEICPVEEEKPAIPMFVNISLHSGAVVLNDVHTAANTGGNLAEGSYAGDGGNGGDIENAGGEQEVEETTTGDGGAGGDAGLGGAVQTGDATAESTVTNLVNSNDIEIDDCACDDSSIALVRIHTHDFALVGNRVDTHANTGDNLAEGSYAGDGGNGGDIENKGADGYDGPPMIPKGGDDHDYHPDGDDADQEVEDSTTGAGGDGGAGSEGGAVLTGQATTRSIITNAVNNNLFRIQ